MSQAQLQCVEPITQELMDVLGTPEQVVPFSQRFADFGFAAAYDIVCRIRDARRERGESPVGRKIGFTNRAIWSDYGISAPIWNYVYDRTVKDVTGANAAFELAAMPEPRIEPEIVLHLASEPAPGMTASDLADCIDWVAPAFEIVFSVFPGWTFGAADAAAAYGVHGALLLGEKRPLSGSAEERQALLSGFTVELENDRGDSRKGHATNVLGGPLQALGFLIDEIARHPITEPLQAGELVTTGTLTEALPIAPGEVWTARFDGLSAKPLRIRLSPRP